MLLAAPLSQHEVVWFDVSMDDVGSVQMLHHLQDADGEVEHKRLRHNPGNLRPVGVHCILKTTNHSTSLQQVNLQPSKRVGWFQVFRSGHKLSRNH